MDQETRHALKEKTPMLDSSDHLKNLAFAVP